MTGDVKGLKHLIARCGRAHFRTRFAAIVRAHGRHYLLAPAPSSRLGSCARLSNRSLSVGAKQSPTSRSSNRRTITRSLSAFREAWLSPTSQCYRTSRLNKHPSADELLREINPAILDRLFRQSPSLARSHMRRIRQVRSGYPLAPNPTIPDRRRRLLLPSPWPVLDAAIQSDPGTAQTLSITNLFPRSKDGVRQRCPTAGLSAS